jgi:hypothetical protein
VERVVNPRSDYDSRPLTIQTVALFNQKSPSKYSRTSWNGDWVFRRDRLELIDVILRNTKPDVALLQEVMARRGNTAESDKSILLAGAFADYGWFDYKVMDFSDTHEIQTMALATAVSIKKVNEADPTVRDSWQIGTDGFLTATTVDFEGEPIAVFNVQMPAKIGQKYLWYTFVEDQVVARIKRLGICRNRVIIGGYMPSDQDSKRFADFMARLQLRDSSAGFCQMASKCHTATSVNELFMATVGDETPGQMDRILVHQSAVVYSSARNFDNSDPNNRYAKGFGISRLWPTQRFGWATQVRLAKCAGEPSLEEF